MGCIINGRLTGKVIINGKVIGEKGSKVKNIDETIDKSICNFKKINVFSNVSDIKISACDTTKVTAHLHGNAPENQDIDFQITNDLDSITISAQTGKNINYNNIQISGNRSVVIDSSTCFNTYLVLEIVIPLKLFKKLSVKNINGEITVLSSVMTELLEADCKNGHVNVDVLPPNLYINCKNGYINVNATATCDSNLDISTKNGCIWVNIANIGTSTVKIKSINGISKNNPHLNGAHKVTGCISSKNGNVTFK